MSFTNRKRAAFTQVLNSALYDKRLKFSDKGLLTVMLSYPDNWAYNVKHLQSLGPDGRDAVYAMLARLEECGYIVRTTKRANGGGFDGVDYEVSDTPIVTQTANGFSVNAETVSAESPTSNTQVNNTKDKRLAEPTSAPILLFETGAVLETLADQTDQMLEREGGEGPLDYLDGVHTVVNSTPPAPSPIELKSPQDFPVTLTPPVPPPSKEMTPDNARKQHFAVQASQRKGAIKTLKEMLGEKYPRMETLIKKHGVKPETALRRLQSEPALRAAFLSSSEASLEVRITLAEIEALKHKSGWEANVGWQFFSWLTKDVEADHKKKGRAKPPVFPVISQLDPDYKSKMEAQQKEYDAWYESNKD